MSERPPSPFFSVVIPTYNRTDRILPTLLSVQDQTFKDFECLVIDDGSADGAALADLIASLADERFVYVRQPNGGACSARNRGIKMARGKFVALLDSDDHFLPEKLATIASVVSERTNDTLVYSQMLVERGLEKKWVRPSRGVLANERVDEYLLCTAGTIRTSTVVVTTQLAQRVLFDERLPSLQDTDFAIRAADAGAAVVFVPEPLVVFEDKVGGHVRVSRNADYKPLLTWLNQLRGNVISERAYWAGRGWQCARIASYSNRITAAGLFIQAAGRGVFPLRHGAVVAAQVLIPYRVYQWVANRVVALLGRRTPA